MYKPASIAQLDGHPTGDWEVAASTPAGSGIILSWNLTIKSLVIFSHLLIQEGHLSVSGQRMCTSSG